jgi:ribosome biogenesis GTPase A
VLSSHERCRQFNSIITGEINGATKAFQSIRRIFDLIDAPGVLRVLQHTDEPVNPPGIQVFLCLSSLHLTRYGIDGRKTTNGVWRGS